MECICLERERERERERGGGGGGKKRTDRIPRKGAGVNRVKNSQERSPDKTIMG